MNITFYTFDRPDVTQPSSFKFSLADKVIQVDIVSSAPEATSNISIPLSVIPEGSNGLFVVNGLTILAPTESYEAAPLLFMHRIDEDLLIHAMGEVTQDFAPLVVQNSMEEYIELLFTKYPRYKQAKPKRKLKQSILYNTININDSVAALESQVDYLTNVVADLVKNNKALTAKYANALSTLAENSVVNMKEESALLEDVTAYKKYLRGVQQAYFDLRDAKQKEVECSTNSTP